MTEQQNTPDLRFSNFLDMWHIHKLSDVATITGGGTPSTKVSEYWDGEIDWYTPNEIGERIYARGSKKKITNLGYKKSSTKLLPINTILFTSRAGIGNTAILAKEGCTNQGFQSIIPNSEKIDSYFIYTISNHIKKYALKHAAGSTFLEISGKELGKMKLFLPSLKEQQKIGVFFSKLDRQIELEEKKLDLLEQQKKGYMQKIFSQEIRFKDENGNDYPDWKEQKLEELGRFNSGVGFPEKYQGGNLGTPFFKVSDMNLPANKTLMNMANNYVTDQQINEKKWKVINDVPAVIFAKVGAAIMLNRKRIVIEPFLMDNNTMSYSFSTHWDTNFGNIFFQTLNLPKYAQVGALPSYNSKDIGTISVNLPSLSEQQKIGDFFSKLDIFIEKQSDKIELLKERKKGFLQKMFI